MAFRYRVRHVEAGDVADARDWNLNHAALAAEFNGHVDRDNLPEVSVDTEDIVPGTFNVIAGDITADPGGASIDGQRIGWQTVQTMSIEVPSDGVIEIEWGGTWAWTTGSSSNNVAFRIVCAGTEVALAPQFAGALDPWSTFLFGEATVGAGTATITVQARTWLTDSTSPTGDNCVLDLVELIAVWRGH
ncbi:MAG TPA: hypothetical protein VI911_04355 [Patescibacteria group bacterium]|nr:hypothetical protein [Patescibacteria group bacterium]